jgi:diacylglycerol kinase family enzyme
MIHKLFNGQYTKHEKVETHRVKHLKVTPKNNTVKAEADGELIGTGPFEISVIEKGFRVFVP